MLKTLSQTLQPLKEAIVSATATTLGFFAIPATAEGITFCLQNTAFLVAIVSGIVGIYRAIKKNRQEKRAQLNKTLSKDDYSEAT